MPYYEELTVRENLTLAAQMRLSFFMREKFERIEQVVNIRPYIRIMLTDTVFHWLPTGT